MSSSRSQLITKAPIKIRKFKPSDIYPYATCLFAGPKKSGKSYAARDIIYYMRDMCFDATVFTGSQEQDHPWTHYVPEAHVNDGFDEQTLGEIMYRQEERKNIFKMHGIEEPDPSKVGHMIVFEDLEYLKKNIFKSESCRKLMLNGRHSKTFTFALVQYIMQGLTLEVRSMFDFAFFTKEPNEAVRKKIHSVFGGCCPFQDFDAIFKMCTEDYKVLAIKLRVNSYDMSDTFFYYKAKDHGKYRIGHPLFWETAERKMYEAMEKERKRIATPEKKNVSPPRSTKKEPAKKKRKVEFNGVYPKDPQWAESDFADKALVPGERAPDANLTYCVKTGHIFELDA